MGGGGGWGRNASLATALCPTKLHHQLVTEVFVPTAGAAALPNRVKPGLGSLAGRTAAEVVAYLRPLLWYAEVVVPVAAR